jgi:hypothetical protein
MLPDPDAQRSERPLPSASATRDTMVGVVALIAWKTYG